MRAFDNGSFGGGRGSGARRNGTSFPGQQSGMLANRLGNGTDFGNNSGGNDKMDTQERLPPPNVGTVQVEIQGWQGGQSIQSAADFIKRKTRIPLYSISSSNNVMLAQVKTSDGQALLQWTGVKYAGNKLSFSIPSTDSQPQNSAITVLREFLRRRYDTTNRLLDLTSMANDPGLRQAGMFASVSTSSKMFPALMKVAGDELRQVDSVSLAGNGLTDITGVTALAQTYPNLKNLSISDNNISNFKGLEPWRTKFKSLRELVLTGNPITALPNYKEETMRIFSSLEVLDGVIVKENVPRPPIELPLKVKANFFENEEIGSMVSGFLTEYIRCFDSDRQQLMPLYDNASRFSISVNTYTPRLGDIPTTVSTWSAYIPLSRNLEKITHPGTRVSRLAVGSTAVGKLFNRIPRTLHHLDDPGKFSVESWTINDVRQMGDSAICLVIHGEYEEVPVGMSSEKVLRSFDRTFIILFNPNPIIVSDLFVVRSWAGSFAWQENQQQAPQQQQQHQQQQAQTQPVGATVPPAPTSSPTGKEFEGLMPEQVTAVRHLMTTTGLNAFFARLCLEQSGYNFDLAMQSFNTSKQQGLLPPEAFQ